MIYYDMEIVVTFYNYEKLKMQILGLTLNSTFALGDFSPDGHWTVLR